MQDLDCDIPILIPETLVETQVEEAQPAWWMITPVIDIVSDDSASLVDDHLANSEDED